VHLLGKEVCEIGWGQIPLWLAGPNLGGDPSNHRCSVTALVVETSASAGGSDRARQKRTFLVLVSSRRRHTRITIGAGFRFDRQGFEDEGHLSREPRNDVRRPGT
jgi:hypothetical protein